VNVVDHRLLLPLLAEHGTVPRVGWAVESIAPGSVVVVGDDGGREEIAVDTVVIAARRRPRSEVVEALRLLAEEVHVAGDCKAPRILYDAIHEGFDAAIEL
jgi:2,4-dienoyl-CoA reductase (NADPH2)